MCVCAFERLLSLLTLNSLSPSLSLPLSFSLSLSLPRSLARSLPRQAAQYWVEISDVMDRSAKDESSQLSKYCTILRAFGNEGREGIVTLCSIASSNFGTDPGSSVLAVRGSQLLRDRGQESTAVVDLVSRGQEHYQWGSVLSPKESEAGRKACYTCLLRQIAWVGFTTQGKGTGAALRDEQSEEGLSLGSETEVSAVCVTSDRCVFKQRIAGLDCCCLTLHFLL
jgi:hypothetical protein